MLIDLSELSPNQVYHTVIQTLLPRPVAWVLSDNGDQSYNLAPFSYFNAVCSNPPLIMLSIGKKPDGSPKDTRANIKERRDFVVHLANRELLDALNTSSASLPAGVSELTELGLDTEPFADFSLPRLCQAPVAMACELYRYEELGPKQQALILAEVKQLYIDDKVVERDEKGRTKIDAAKVDPISRLGGTEYALFGEVVSRPRPA